MVFSKVCIGTTRLGLKYISEMISKEPGKDFMIQQYRLKGVSSKPSGKMILGPDFCFSS